MLKKLLLAITITFSLNVCLEVRQQEQSNTNTSFQGHMQPKQAVLVSVPNK
ncbi:hypothetical protein NIES4071_100460 [Calothrix sp. NIES-4071]|nr:hypothetical protein NIES4071_100460 [Calothrix sp. NIES-4071]BAZ64308.1 hypothetical protein NIES4105_100390 [Calothrix sp. NIES-4105]